MALRLDGLRKEIAQLKTKKNELERNIATCDNQALLARFRQSLSEVENELRLKEADIENLEMFS